MALANYADLQAAVAAWIDRDDLAAKVPDFIRLAEAELSRELRVPQMEARAQALTTATGRIPMPLDARAIRLVNIHEGGRMRPLEMIAPLAARAAYSDLPGRAVAYSIADEQIWLWPRPAEGLTVEIVYSRSIPALSGANTKNWLLSAHPDLYLFASIMQAEFYGWNDQRLPLVKARVDELIERVNLEGRRKNLGGGARLRVPNVV